MKPIPRPQPHRSLRDRVALLIVVTAAILSILAITISFIIYKRTMDQHYTSLCSGAVDLMLAELDGDAVETYLASGEETPDYLADEARLSELLCCLPDLTYLYVYQIRSDGCHVVFDIDTPELPGAALGELVAFDESFSAALPDLLAGRDIAPITTHGQYGWLLSVYKPVRNSAGDCVAYAAADISMNDVLSDRYMFVIRMISLLIGASIIIVSFALYYAQRQIVTPINSLASAASHFAGDESDRTRDALQSLGIHTGDEIENLYHSLSKTVSDMVAYIDLISEKNAEVASKAATIERMQDNIIISFANMVENRDENTGSHVKHTAAYVHAVGAALCRRHQAPSEHPDEWLDTLTRSAPLHDIGKIRIPDAILNKPGKLTSEEFETIKTHTTAGHEILRETLDGIEGRSYLSEAIDMATYHHERWDGTGYPCRLKGEEIPLSARIMAVADVFDALISKRSYKGPLPFDKAIEIIESESGSHFDPAIVDAFLSVKDEIRTLSESL